MAGMKISFIGAGRVAHHLAKALSPKHQIVDVYSRSGASAQALADQVAARVVTSAEDLNPEIDIAIIAVSDQAIEAVVGDIGVYLRNVCLVHTSGSTAMQVLSAVHDRVGVFYPLQTFSFESVIDWSNTPLLIEAQYPADEKQLLQLAQQMSQRVYVYSSEQRLSLHLAAVFACNFSNYCFDMAQQIVDAQQVDFSLLHPLMLETVKKATQHPPHSVQTGPAKRGDQNILNLHQSLLHDAARQDLQQVYALLSQQIQQREQ